MSSPDAQYVNYPDNSVEVRLILHFVGDLSCEAVVKYVGVRIPELIQRLAVVAVPVGVPVQSAVAFDLSRESSTKSLDPGLLVDDLEWRGNKRSQAAVGYSDLPVPSDSAVFYVREGRDRNAGKMGVGGSVGE